MGRRRANEWDLWYPVQLAASDPDREVSTFLEPVFGSQPFTPRTTCEDIHPGGPIPRGSPCCCMACHRSGKDFLKLKGEAIGKRMDPDYKDDDPEPKPTVYEPRKKPEEKPNRRQRRAIQFPRPEAAA